MAEPRHITEQAVSPQDKAHMEKTAEDRKSEAEERAAEQFGDPPAQSPDPYPENSGDATLTPRDEGDMESPSGSSAKKSATTADDHQSKEGGGSKKSSSSGASKSTASSSSSSS